MNISLDEAQAICDGSNRIYFCSEHMAIFDSIPHTVDDLVEYIENSEDNSSRILAKAALTVLRANIARAAGQAELL